MGREVAGVPVSRMARRALCRNGLEPSVRAVCTQHALFQWLHLRLPVASRMKKVTFVHFMGFARLPLLQTLVLSRHDMQPCAVDAGAGRSQASLSRLLLRG